jgi:hypothetical protein
MLVELESKEKRMHTLGELVDFRGVGVGVLAMLSEWLQGGGVPFRSPEGTCRGRIVGGGIIDRIRGSSEECSGEEREELHGVVCCESVFVFGRVRWIASIQKVKTQKKALNLH